MPAHSTIDFGVSLKVACVTLQPQVFRPEPPISTVMWGHAQTYHVPLSLPNNVSMKEAPLGIQYAS